MKPPARLILIATLICGSCGDQAPPAPAPEARHGPAVQRLLLQPAEHREAAAPEVVHRFDLAAAKQWKIQAEQHRVVQLPGSAEPGLLLLGRSRRSIAAPVGLPRTAFNQLQLRVLARTDCTMHVGFTGPDDLRARARTDILGAPEPQTITLDVLEERKASGTVSRMHLAFSDDCPSVAIDSLVLQQRPLPYFWPPAPQLRSAAGELRQVVGLTSDNPLASAFEVRPQETLRFTATPAEGSIPGLSIRTTVTADDGSEQQHRLQLEPDRWVQSEISLAAFAGQVVEAHFELRTTTPGPVADVALVSVPLVVSGEPDLPSVLLVTSDTHRADYVGHARSGVRVSTPVIDALGARGLIFEDCYSATNVTNPSHISIMTGTHPRDTGIVDNRTRLSRSAPTLAAEFREAGYVTFASVSASHLDDAISGLGHGFDRMSAAEEVRDAEDTVDVLERWLPDVEGLPVFVWLHVFDAHFPYQPPPGFVDEYYPPDRDPRDPTGMPEVPTESLPEMFRDIRDLEYPDALYRGEITYLDQQLGRLVYRPRFENGIVAITADHGENLGEHQLFYDHAGLFPQTVHVPLVLAFPGAERLGDAEQRRVQRPVSTLDVARTLLEVAGIDSGFAGRSLLEVEHLRRFSLSAHALSAAVADDRWFCVLQLRDYTNSRHPAHVQLRHKTQLFDLRLDPECNHDVVDQHFDTARELRADLVRWLCSAEPKPWIESSSSDAALLAQLQTLGYAEVEGVAGEALIDPQCDCERCAKFD